MLRPGTNPQKQATGPLPPTCTLHPGTAMHQPAFSFQTSRRTRALAPQAGGGSPGRHWEQRPLTTGRHPAGQACAAVAASRTCASGSCQRFPRPAGGGRPVEASADTQAPWAFLSANVASLVTCWVQGSPGRSSPRTRQAAGQGGTAGGQTGALQVEDSAQGGPGTAVSSRLAPTWLRPLKARCRRGVGRPDPRA